MKRCLVDVNVLLAMLVRQHEHHRLTRRWFELDSAYEPGKRSGAWQKMRLNQGQEFVIGGYTPSPKNFDALVFGYYEGSDLMYAARTRDGFTPASRGQLFRKFQGLEISRCPFVNLPEAHPGRWGQGVTADTMKEGGGYAPSWSPISTLWNGLLTAACGIRNSWDSRRQGPARCAGRLTS